MASPQKLAAKLYSLSPRLLKHVEKRQYLSPRSPVLDSYRKNVEKRNQLSPFSLDTPNRRKILENGLPDKHSTILGIGGFGTVYKALYKGDQIAAKVMQTQKCCNALNSEKHATFLKHSNIVNVLMIEQGPSLSLIAMELCGPTLQDRLDKTVLARSERVSILKDVTNALQFCHDAGIVHADVKPANILMGQDGTAKLTDFGSSVPIGESNEANRFYGTPGYTAPETLKGNAPTPAADIYSLGIVAWQMISRKSPFSGLHSHTIIYISVKGNRPTDDEIDDEFNGVYKNLYRQMWSENASDRPTTSQVISKINVMIAQHRLFRLDSSLNEFDGS